MSKLLSDPASTLSRPQEPPHCQAAASWYTLRSSHQHSTWECLGRQTSGIDSADAAKKHWPCRTKHAVWKQHRRIQKGAAIEGDKTNPKTGTRNGALKANPVHANTIRQRTRTLFWVRNLDPKRGPKYCSRFLPSKGLSLLKLPGPCAPPVSTLCGGHPSAHATSAPTCSRSVAEGHPRRAGGR